ncbi:hypothetical protein D3C87_1298320 [compost metagenome]
MTGGIDHGDDHVQLHLTAQLWISQGLHDALRIGHAAALDDDAFQARFQLRQAAELRQQIFLHGAADAAVLQAVHGIRHFGNDGRIDVQLAEVVDDHRQPTAFGTAHHAVE